MNHGQTQFCIKIIQEIREDLLFRRNPAAIDAKLTSLLLVIEIGET